MTKMIFAVAAVTLLLSSMFAAATHPSAPPSCLCAVEVFLTVTKNQGRELTMGKSRFPIAKDPLLTITCEMVSELRIWQVAYRDESGSVRPLYSAWAILTELGRTSLQKALAGKVGESIAFVCGDRVGGVERVSTTVPDALLLGQSHDEEEARWFGANLTSNIRRGSPPSEASELRR